MARPWMTHAVTRGRRLWGNARYRASLVAAAFGPWIRHKAIEARFAVSRLLGQHRAPVVRLSLYIWEQGHRRERPGLVAVGSIGSLALVTAAATGERVGAMSMACYRPGEDIPARPVTPLAVENGGKLLRSMVYAHDEPVTVAEWGLHVGSEQLVRLTFEPLRLAAGDALECVAVLSM